MVEARVGRAWFQGAFVPLADPVPGGTGKDNSIWPRVANCLARDLALEDLVISMRAVGGSSIADWSEGGKHFADLRDAIDDIKACPLEVTHVIFHQGERDTLEQTASETYIARFMPLYDLITSVWGAVPWVLCRASHRMGVQSAEVIAAQNELIQRLDNCHGGPNTDLLGEDYRYDDTHFNARGLDAFAEQLCASLRQLASA
jgi:hypothetical protein